MTILKRDEIIAEHLIREHVRNRISAKLREDFLVEQKLRKAVQKLLEAETGTEEPSTYTGINVLASLLEKIIPILEDDYKMLTTSEEQRESFRNHIIHAMKNALRPIEAATAAENLPENYSFTINKSLLAEKMKIDLDADDSVESVEGDFIDIEGGSSETDDFVELQDQNETGRNFAAVTFQKVEKQIVDAFDMLADEEDQNLFYDYLITNMLLYFDKFEDELQPVLPDSTTPEYEDAKDEEANSPEETPEETPEEAPEETPEETSTADLFG